MEEENTVYRDSEGITSGMERERRERSELFSSAQLCCSFIAAQLESQDPCLDYVKFLLHPGQTAGMPKVLLDLEKKQTRQSIVKQNTHFSIVQV